MKSLKAFCSVSLFLFFAVLTGCGGGSTATSSTGTSGGGAGNTQPATKVTDFAGTWTGTYQTNSVVSLPFTFNVSSTNIYSSSAAVSFASSQASGSGGATYDATTHNLSFNFTSPDGTTIYHGVMSMSGTTMNLESLTGGTITSGAGSCAAPVISYSMLNLGGIWTGTSTTSVVGSGAVPDAGGDIHIILASDGNNGYVGALTDSTGAYSGNLTVQNMSNFGSPTVWQYHLTRSSINGTTEINVSGGFDTRSFTFGADGKPVGGLTMALDGYTAAAGSGITASLGLSIQRQ